MDEQRCSVVLGDEGSDVGWGVVLGEPDLVGLVGGEGWEVLGNEVGDGAVRFIPEVPLGVWAIKGVSLDSGVVE